MSNLWKRAAGAAILVVVVAPTATYLLSAKSATISAQTRGKPVKSGSTQIQTIVSRESADGFTEADINVNVMLKLEARTLEQFRAGMVRELSTAGKTFNPARMTADSVVTEIGSRRLIVTRIKTDGQVTAAQVFGVNQQEAVRVACVPSAIVDDIVMSRECRARVQSIFGVNLNLSGNRNG